jgi:aryl carrier-like protein
MGIVYVPEDIVSLDALGLDEFPRTMSGKIQKAELRKLVATYRENLSPDSTSNHESTKQVVLHAWWKATGIEIDRLNQDAPTSNFADSIMIMRVRDSYRKELGVTLSLAEMSEAVNLKGQMVMLQRKSTSQQQAAVYPALGLSGPPTLEELQAIIGPENNATAFKETINSTLAAKGFEYLDVESVIPTSDFTNVMVNSNIMRSWDFGIAVIAERFNVQVCCTVHAFEKKLTHILRSH